MPSAADGYHPLDVQANSMRGSWAGAGSVTLAGLATRCSQSSRSATSVRVKLSASEPIRPPSESFAALPPSRRSTRQVMSPHRPAPRERPRAQRLPFRSGCWPCQSHAACPVLRRLLCNARHRHQRVLEGFVVGDCFTARRSTCDRLVLARALRASSRRFDGQGYEWGGD